MELEFPRDEAECEVANANPMGFAVAAADAVVDENSLSPILILKIRAAIFAKTPVWLDLIIPVLNVFLKKTTSIVAAEEIFQSQVSIVS